jgi:hypothetical protein
MNWTQETPEIQGWWCFNSGDVKGWFGLQKIVLISESTGGPSDGEWFVYQILATQGIPLSEWIERYPNGWWAGPIGDPTR